MQMLKRVAPLRGHQCLLTRPCGVAMANDPCLAHRAGLRRLSVLRLAAWRAIGDAGVAHLASRSSARWILAVAPP